MINDLLGGSGSPYLIRHGGKTYEMSALTQEVKGRFESLLKQKAVGVLELLPPARYEQALSRLQQDIASGLYSFHSELSLSAMQTPGGSILFLAALLNCGEDEAMEIFTRQGEQVMAMIKLRIEEARPRGNG